MNDAESFTIIKIAKRLGFEVRVSTQNSWFCPLYKEPNYLFRELKSNVVIIEMPGPEKEAHLSKDHNVILIDHHGYPSLKLDREHKKSSLEQFSDLVGYKLSSEEMGIAINDQEYIYGLKRAGYSLSQIQDIRKLDISLQGYTEDELEELRKDFKNGFQLKNGIQVYHSSVRDKFSYLMDLHVMNEGAEYSNVVIFGNSGREKGKFIFFSGSMEIVNKLKKLGGFSKKSTSLYGLWGGFKKGDEKVSILDAEQIIKNHLF
jgi:hypothetical protein